MVAAHNTCTSPAARAASNASLAASKVPYRTHSAPETPTTKGLTVGLCELLAWVLAENAPNVPSLHNADLQTLSDNIPPFDSTGCDSRGAAPLDYCDPGGGGGGRDRCGVSQSRGGRRGGCE